MSRKCSRCGCFLSGYSIGHGWTMCHACEPTVRAYQADRACQVHGLQHRNSRNECRICNRDKARLRQQRARDRKKGSDA